MERDAGKSLDTLSPYFNSLHEIMSLFMPNAYYRIESISCMIIRELHAARCRYIMLQKKRLNLSSRDGRSLQALLARQQNFWTRPSLLRLSRHLSSVCYISQVGFAFITAVSQANRVFRKQIYQQYKW